MSALEYRVIGPPGTGKTTWIGQEVARRVADGIHPNEICLVSHTRAAAYLLGEAADLPEANAATFHAFAYRHMGSPPIVTSDKLRAEWNKRVDEHGWPKAYKLPAQGKQMLNAQLHDADEFKGVLAHNYESHFAAYTLLRSRMTTDAATLAQWGLTEFVDLYEAFKDETFSVDFHAMVEYARDEMTAPLATTVRVVIIDEVQDSSTLQWAITDVWRQNPDLERLIVVGDDAQVIYGWQGASVEPLQKPLPPEQVRVLSKSYRLPRVIKHYAEETVLSKHSSPMMEGRVYAARDEEGELRSHYATYMTPQLMVDELRAQVDNGKTVMYLAQSGYMLDPFIDVLLREGIPFHNPYRVENGRWNPIAGRAGRIYRALSAVSENNGRNLSRAQWRTLINMFATHCFGKGVATRARKGEIPESPEGPFHLGVVDPKNNVLVFGDDTINALLDLDWDWLRANGKAGEKRLSNDITFAERLYKSAGTALVDAVPRVIVGTIHSVKGAEADCVWLVPDVSNAAWREATNASSNWDYIRQQEGQVSSGMDALIRLMYVGVTRAREALTILTPYTERRLETLVINATRRDRE